MPDADLYLPDGRGLGRIPDTSRRKAALPRFGIELPDSELGDFLDSMPLEIKNQDGRGACNGFAAVTALEYARFVAGMPHVELSPWFVYAILCNGIDRGSMILDALELTTQTGTCPDNLVPYATISPRKLSAEARQQAARFRIEIGNRLESWREIVSAVRLRRGLNLSLRASGAFDRLDAEGVAGATRGVGNHAVFVGGGLKHSDKHGWVVLCRNSWGTGWGHNGTCYLSERHWASQSYKECYEVVAVHDDPADSDNPPGLTTAEAAGFCS